MSDSAYEESLGAEGNGALKDEILTFLKTPRALASAVVAGYRKNGFGYTSLVCGTRAKPIHAAVLHQLEFILENLLEEISDLTLNAKDEAMRTPFHVAAGSGFLGCAQLLLAAGADIWTRDYEGCTPFSTASRLGHASIVNLILEHGRTAEWTTEEIRAAILTTQKSAIEQYIQAAPKPTEKANSILLESSALGNPQIIEIACSFGADVNVEDQKGRTALLIAV